MNSKVE